MISTPVYNLGQAVGKLRRLQCEVANLIDLVPEDRRLDPLFKLLVTATRESFCWTQEREVDIDNTDEDTVCVVMMYNGIYQLFDRSRILLVNTV